MKTMTLIKDSDGLQWVGRTIDGVLSTLRNGKYIVTVEKHREPRTLSQNALMWMWLSCIERETGTPKEDVYSYYCRKFLCRVTVINGKEVTVNDTSSMLSTGQMSEFMTQIQADAAMELGIMLPLPTDRYYHEFVNEYRNECRR